MLTSKIEKIQSQHIERKAVIYIRQSTPQQVLEHAESTKLQYQLVERAQELGWHSDQIKIIDEDLGKSGSSIEGRTGFKDLLAEVGLDRVGIIFGIEMSRLARSCKDWHHLLDLCAIFHTLLADQDGLYDPTEYNDRLLLGLKGTMSEAELHIIKNRMREGRWNKARRGELFSHPPVGYIRSPSGDYIKDPDEQVQSVIELIFNKFFELRTINRLLQYLVKNSIEIGFRKKTKFDKGQLEWRRPNRMTLQYILTHPVYAGAYRYGHRLVDSKRKKPGRPYTGRTFNKHDQCEVLIKNHLPAYITWKQFLDIQEQLKANQVKAESMGTARDGKALLTGILICGICNRRMNVSYDKKGKRYRYVCMRNYTDYGMPNCQSLQGENVDNLVENQVLEALQPASIELSIAAINNLEEEKKTLDKNWQQRIERAKYEVHKASRHYYTVDPDNRLVARELEKTWNEKLKDLEKLEEDYIKFKESKDYCFTEDDKEKILSISSDIAKLWKSPTTTVKDRKEIIRFMISKVTITIENNSESVIAKLYWRDNQYTEHTFIRPVAKYTQMSNYLELKQKIIELHDRGQSNKQIAEYLNKNGWQPPKRASEFSQGMVSNILIRERQLSKRPKEASKKTFLKENEWWIDDLARKLEMPVVTLYNWTKRGWINYRQLAGKQGRLILWADEEELTRLTKLRVIPGGWAWEEEKKKLTTPKNIITYKDKEEK